jgi:hypothetical protein
MYSQIRNLGGEAYCSDVMKAYDYCLLETVDRGFGFGPGANTAIGPAAPRCQAFMAEQCSLEWNPFCEAYYRQYGRCGGSNERRFPGTATTASFAQAVGAGGGEGAGCRAAAAGGYGHSLGDAMLRQTAVRRYYRLEGHVPSHTELLVPADASSPAVTLYSAMREPGTYKYPLSEHAHSPMIDHDRVMQLMLANPEPFTDILYDLYTRTQATETHTYECLTRLFSK